ncbi:MAG: hypothetical protein U5K74_05535 [Gemmatimonadaceae bacterium]|nr:hypothetical protein [Gemmatimonadaceae bacterium]
MWGDSENFRIDGARVAPEWQGDVGRWTSTYWTRWQGVWAYTQGDFAMRYADGSFSLHGRSDDVINVSGHRLGTEEIEGAILRDKQLRSRVAGGQRDRRRCAASREGADAAGVREADGWAHADAG